MIQTAEKTVPKYILSDKFTGMLESARGGEKLAGLSALIVDATDTPHRDVFRFLQKSVLHLGAVSVASLLDSAGFGEVKAVYEVLTPDYDYSKDNPDFVGVSAIITNVPFANTKIEYFRKTMPNALIGAGGAGYSFNPEMALEHGADFVVVGKAEYPLLELINRASCEIDSGRSLREGFLRADKDIDGVIISRRKFELAPMVRDLRAVPQINYDLIEGKQSKSMRSVRDSEGCPNKCDFCSTTLLHRFTYRADEPERVVDELKKARENRIGQVFFIGDNFFARNYPNLENLLSEIEKENTGVEWVAQASVSKLAEYFDRGLLQRLERCRCSVLCLGIESIYDNDLGKINSNNKSSSRDLKRVLGALKKSRIEAHAMLVLKPLVNKELLGIVPYSAENSPRGIREYDREISQTVDFLKEHNVRTAQFHSSIPLPGTPNNMRYFEAGLILKNVDGKPVGWDKYTGQYVVASHNPYESHKIMINAYRRFYSGGYILEPFLNLSKSAGKNRLGQSFFRALGKGAVFAYTRTDECKRYAEALKAGDYEFY